MSRRSALISIALFVGVVAIGWLMYVAYRPVLDAKMNAAIDQNIRISNERLQERQAQDKASSVADIQSTSQQETASDPLVNASLADALLAVRAAGQTCGTVSSIEHFSDSARITCENEGNYRVSRMNGHLLAMKCSAVAAAGVQGC